MLDKVIKGLECCKAKNIDHDYDACDRCPYNGRKGGEGCYILYADALTLLKEQPDIVMCKDCRHQDPDRFNNDSDRYVCRKGHGWKPDDRFCADG